MKVKTFIESDDYILIYFKSKINNTLAWYYCMVIDKNINKVSYTDFLGSMFLTSYNVLCKII
jgi:hypothetical protein